MKIAILHQGFIPRYRVRFFELINERTGCEYVVFHGDPPTGLGHEAADGAFAFPNVRVSSHELVLPNSRSLIYQRVLRHIRHGAFDGVVLGTHIQFVSNHAVFALSRLQRRAVLYWGHGVEKVVHNGAMRPADGGRLDRLLVGVASRGVTLKNAAAKLADGYLVYTDGGASCLRANGVDPDRITVLRNTIDMREQISLHEQTLGLNELALRRELGLHPHSVILVFVGRLYADRRVEDLVDAVRELNSVHRPARPFQVVVIGDGPSALAIRARAAGMSNFIFTGSIYDSARVARYLRVASVMVIPKRVGLVAVHALAHGLPLITQASEDHGPEIEYLTSGYDALIARDFNEFVQSLCEIIDSEDRVRELSAAALRTRERLSLENMVDAFHGGVTRAVSRLL